MFDESTICPYSGLRSFSEEESIFFKGRDPQIDEITKLLEKNKFLMVTGASGEGKSSLVYAGMIPNARAGFFKAKYSNWQVVDFRPERTPLSNLSKSLSLALNYENNATIETELQRGYAALVDVYKNSVWYKDADEPLTESNTEASRQNANLLIIVDQFEEFFTNPENYNNSTPSEAAQTTLNLLLETARIALKENLPIYVVCTMRSDYIGQCSAFRGLPEAIGFSQFFVPRLKRNELKLIIEEPAILNGNSISKRLTERLLYDLSEGIDQLPILQHALSHIWQAADNGKEKLDLIHYALVGGMPSSDLPDEDKPRFVKWFKSLPEFQRNLYHTPSIKRVIEIHANQLYEGAYTYFKKQNSKAEVSLQEVKNVVALTFACLTKIDDSRAVRNRMTLQEITGIINKAHITVEVVNDILNIFREQDNSFIRPFISDEASSALNPDTVLDITHESLIRNWDLLNQWANKEYDYYITFLDFRKQLNRWLDAKKSNGYLLPIGSLSYFENWEKTCNPNKYWIHRYEGNNGIWLDTLAEAGELLDKAHEFLKKSNRKVLIARTFMKYGANRIAAILAIVVVFLLSGFYFYDAETKRNTYVINSTISKGNVLLGSRDIRMRDKADYLTILERRNPGSMISYLHSLDNEQYQIDLAIECYDRLLYYDKKNSGTAKYQLYNYIENHLLDHSSHAIGNDFIIELNKLTILLAYDYYYNFDEQTVELLQKISGYFYNHLLVDLNDNNQISAGEINKGIQFYLTFGKPSVNKLNELIAYLSPFNSNSNSLFNKIYPKGSTEPNGRIEVSFDGGYYTVASLYAAVGDEKHLIRSLDSLNLNKDYFTGIAFNNSANLLGFIYEYGHAEMSKEFINKVSQLSGKEDLELYQDFLDRSGYMKYFYSSNINFQISESNAGYYSPNLTFLLPSTLGKIRSDYNNRLNLISDKNKGNYLKALSAKQEAIFYHKYNFDRNIDYDAEHISELFNKSIISINNIDPEYLNKNEAVTYRYYGGGPRERNMTRKEVFIYPDVINGFVSNVYHSPIFLNYMVENELVTTYYKNDGELELLNYWLNNFYEVYSFSDENAFKNDFPLTDEYLLKVKLILSTNSSDAYDLNFINLVLANRMFEAMEIKKGKAFYSELNLDNYKVTIKKYEYLNESFFLNQVRDLSIHLALNGMHSEAVNQIETMQRISHKVQTYLYVAEALYKQNYNPKAFDYLDSAFTLAKDVKTRELSFREDYRSYQAYLLAFIGGDNSEVLLTEVIKSMHELRKIPALESPTRGHAAAENYYQATIAMHSSLTEAADLRCYTTILYYETLATESIESKLFWKGMDDERNHFLNYKYDVRFL